MRWLIERTGLLGKPQAKQEALRIRVADSQRLSHGTVLESSAKRLLLIGYLQTARDGQVPNGTVHENMKRGVRDESSISSSGACDSARISDCSRHRGKHLHPLQIPMRITRMRERRSSPSRRPPARTPAQSRKRLPARSIRECSIRPNGNTGRHSMRRRIPRSGIR